MNLICKINGKVYDKNIAQGLTISEEYNETLDSGAIILTHVNQIVDLKPYDDVWIYDGPDDYITAKKNGKFHRHFLVDNYSEKILNLEESIYEYTIELFSETKLLEKIICPSTCVTEPLDIQDKHDIVWYLKKYIELYSPEIKRAKVDGTWEYQKKYSLSENLVGSEDGKVVGKVQGKYPQDFQLTNPTLREILTQLLLTQDLIPIVKDDVIDAIDITQRIGEFHNNNIDEIKEYVNSITGSMSSDNYTDSLRKTYTEAISQECLSSNIERIGFRNKDSALLTLSNLQIETRFPIYSIEQALLCYYKRLKLEKSDGTILYQDVLCKQDITPFILLNSARNVLSKDWSELESIGDPSTLSVEDITKYRMYTLGYDIGNNVITGWGEMYSYPKDIGYDTTLTYIQNILYYLERKNPFGINLNNYMSEKLLNREYKNISFLNHVDKKNPFNIIPNIWGEKLLWTTDVGTKIKSMFVELKYKGFFKGTVITSKDGGRDYIQTSDNSNSSLTLLEKDGLAQKEKINRFGNKTMVFTARYPGNGYDLVQPLGCVYSHDEDGDIVIYHKEMAFYDNAITCTYYGARDYVLKNFYTSVRAKLRLNRLMGYEESVRRCENEKVEILFSKDKLYYEKVNNVSLEPIINSAFTASKTVVDSVSEIIYNTNNSINAGVITGLGDTYGGIYFTDINKSVNGKSIVFNMAMYDNVSPGVYIKEIKPDFNAGLLDGYKLYEEANGNDLLTVEKYKAMQKAISNYTDLTGSTQEWYLLTDDNGESKEIRFSIGTVENTAIPDFSYAVSDLDLLDDVTRKNYTASFLLPAFSGGSTVRTVWETPIYKKDNKEILDQTFQIEYCLDEKDDVFVGQNYLLLNDMVNSSIIKKEAPEAFSVTTIKIGRLFSGVCKTNGGNYPFIDLSFGDKDNFYEQIKKIYKNIDSGTLEIEMFVSNDLVFGQPNDKLGFTPEYELLNEKTSEFIQHSSPIGRTQSIDYIVSEDNVFLNLNYDKTNEIIKDIFIVMPVTIYYTIWDVDEYGTKMYGNYYEKNREIKFKLKLVENNNNLIAKSDFSTSHYSVEFLNYDGSQESLGYNGASNIMIDTMGRILNLAPYHPIEDTCINAIYYADEAKYCSFKSNDINADGLRKEMVLRGETNKVIEDYMSTPQTMFVVYSTNPCTKTTEYEQYKPKYVDKDGKEIDDFKNAGYYIKGALKVSGVFVVENNKIIVKKPGLINKKVGDETILYNIDNELTETLGEDVKIKSIQYWYYDNATHSYKFVFGINLTENTTEESVYFSVVKNKDTRVFDENGEVVGHIHNFAGEEKPVFDENGEVVGEEEPDFAQKFD